MVTMNSTEGKTPARLEEWAIGCQVSLLTTLEEIIDGTVFAFDPLSNCLVITETSSSEEKLDFRVLKASFIKKILSASLPDCPVDRHLPYVDLTPPQIQPEDQDDRASWGRETDNEEQQPSPVAEPMLATEPAPEENPAFEEVSKSEGVSRQEEKPRKSPVPVVRPVMTYASVSKGADHSSTSAPSSTPGVPPVKAPVVQPKGPWHIKNPKIISSAAYAQGSSNTQQNLNSTEGEGSKSSSGSGSTIPGMVTMSLKPRGRH